MPGQPGHFLRMKIALILGSILCLQTVMTFAAGSLFDVPLKDIDGKATTLKPYQGKVMLIVNVASHCGYTPQYAGLETTYQKYEKQGLAVLGFPCNQFGGQEPGNAEEIESFCKVNFGISFPLMAKIDVNGDAATPLYDWLKAEAPGVLGTKGIKWNFTKFLIDKTGKVVSRYAPTDKPEALGSAIEALL